MRAVAAGPWPIAKIGYLVRELGGSTPSKERVDFWGGAVPWVSPKDMKTDLISDSIDHITDVALATTSLRLIPVGAVLVVVRGMILAHSVPVGLTTVPVTVNQDMKALIPLDRVTGLYLRYCLQAHRDLLLALVEEAGHGTRCLRSERWRKFEIPCPPLPLQKAIADFLDRKTAAIDALIEKKQKLLELLAEKRAALINQAVTKGLDPSVPMKDSGIPWIGQIPAHWEVKRLKHLSSFVTSGPRGWGQYYSESGPLFLRITNVSRDRIELLLGEDKRQSVTPPIGAEGARTLAAEGDLLISITADLGSVGVVPAGIGEAYVSQHIALCRPANIRPRLLAYMVGGLWGRIHYELSMNGGTKVGLTLDDVRNTPVAMPPHQEQNKLVGVLVGMESKFEGLSGPLERQVGRLCEYRQALITAAVTGQLDIPAGPA